MEEREWERRFLLLRDQLRRPEDAIPTGGTQLLGVAHRTVRSGGVVLCLPDAVGIVLVQEERRHPLPALRDIARQRDDAALAEQPFAGIGATELLDLVSIESPSFGHGG